MCGNRSGSETSMLSNLIFRNLTPARINPIPIANQSPLLLKPTCLRKARTDPRT